MGGSRSRQDPPPDIEMGFSLRARELHFDSVPEIQTGSYGTPGHEVKAEARREGLPDRVEAGVTYGKVRMRGRVGLRISRRLSAG